MDQKQYFKLSVTGSGKKQYLHVENGKKREELIKDRMAGKISPKLFEEEQAKMRGGKYLKYIYSESEFKKIKNAEIES